MKAMEAFDARVREDVDKIEKMQKDLLDFANDNPGFEDDIDEFTALAAKLQEARRKALTRAPVLTAQIKVAQDRLKSAAHGKTELLAEWATIDGWVNANLQQAEADMSGIGGILTSVKAEAARMARDAKELKQIQDSVTKTRDQWKAFAGSLKQRLGDFDKEFAAHRAEFGPGALNTLKSARDVTSRKIARISDLVAQQSKTCDAVLKLKIDPIDIKKAAAALGIIAANLLPKLEKALVDADPTGMMKALEKILKEAGQSLSGKDAVAKLRKAKVL